MVGPERKNTRKWTPSKVESGIMTKHLFTMRDSDIPVKVIDFTSGNATMVPFWVGFRTVPKVGDSIPGREDITVADVWPANPENNRPVFVWALAKGWEKMVPVSCEEHNGVFKV